MGLFAVLSFAAVFAGCASSRSTNIRPPPPRPRPLAAYAAGKRVKVLRPGQRRIRLPQKIEARRGRATLILAVPAQRARLRIRRALAARETRVNLPVVPPGRRSRWPGSPGSPQRLRVDGVSISSPRPASASDNSSCRRGCRVVVRSIRSRSQAAGSSAGRSGAWLRRSPGRGWDGGRLRRLRAPGSRSRRALPRALVDLHGQGVGAVRGAVLAGIRSLRGGARGGPTSAG